MIVIRLLNKTAPKSCSTGFLLGVAIVLLVSGIEAIPRNHQAASVQFLSGENVQLAAESFDHMSFSREEGKIHICNMVKIAHAIKLIKSRIPAPEAICQCAMETHYADDFFRGIADSVFQHIPLHLIHCIFLI